MALCLTLECEQYFVLLTHTLYLSTAENNTRCLHDYANVSYIDNNNNNNNNFVLSTVVHSHDLIILFYSYHIGASSTCSVNVKLEHYEACHGCGKLCSFLPLS